MEFREAMDLAGVSAVELGERLGVSPQTIRQARLDPSSDGHRTPPDGWEAALLEVAERRGDELKELVKELRRGQPA